MSLVIYLGLSAFTRQPHLLLPPGQEPISLKALEEGGQHGTILLDEVTESASHLLHQWLNVSGEHYIELHWPDPAPFIAAKMTQGSLPHELQESWKAQTQRLLALFRKHRSQLALFGYTPGQPMVAQGTALAELPPLDTLPIYRLAAVCLIKEDAEFKQAHAYLKASSRTTKEGQQDPLADITGALQGQQKFEEIEQENTLYAQQLDQAQQTLEQQLHELAENRKSVEEAKQAEQSLSQTLAQKDQQIRDVQEENDMVIKELHRVQEAFEQSLIDQDQRLVQLHSVQEELEQRHLEQQRIEQLAESRQRHISKNEQRIHHLHALVQWLRVSAYRYATAAYRSNKIYRKALPKQVNVIEQSRFFDASWYCEQYPDVAKSGINPAEHFVKFGALEGRNPCAEFNTEYYLQRYQDVAVSGQHPLLHYLRNGMAEKRVTQPDQPSMATHKFSQVNARESLT